MWVCDQSLSLCLTPCGSMDCSLPGASIHGILQASVLEWNLLQGIFPAQGRNLSLLDLLILIWGWNSSLLHLLNCRWILYGRATREAPQNIMEAPQDIKNRTTIWSSCLPSGGFCPKIEIRISKRYLHNHIHCNVIDSISWWRQNLQCQWQMNGQGYMENALIL